LYIVECDSSSANVCDRATLDRWKGELLILGRKTDKRNMAVVKTMTANSNTFLCRLEKCDI
jgi:hypothetical protein